MGSDQASRFESGHWTGAGGDDALVSSTSSSGTKQLTTDPYQKVTVGGTPVIAAPVAKPAGARVVVQVKQDSTGTRIPTWSGVKWAAGTAPTLSTPANSVDRVLLECDGVDWWGSLVGKAFA